MKKPEHKIKPTSVYITKLETVVRWGRGGGGVVMDAVYTRIRSKTARAILYKTGRVH